MPPRYRGKLTGGRPDGYRRRRRLAIVIEVARFLSSLGLLYLAAVCAIGVAVWLANHFDHDISDNVASLPVIGQMGIQSDLIAGYGAGLPAVLLATALVFVVAIHFLANFLIDDIVDR